MRSRGTKYKFGESGSLHTKFERNINIENQFILVKSFDHEIVLKNSLWIINHTLHTVSLNIIQCRITAQLSINTIKH